jgi:short-subunit dehydrogenase
MTAVNRFPMPFILDADKAASKIKRGLDSKKSLLVFPWPMGVLARLQNLLPDRFINWIYGRVPAKPSSS